MEARGKKRWMKIKELREYHRLSPDDFYAPKMFYTPPERGELYVSFFSDELRKGQDIYTEAVDREFNSEDKTRTLYRWNYNEHWHTQYEKIDHDPVRYLVPLRELEKVNEELFECNDGDCPMNEMTMRDLVAIWIKRPVSNKKWLNDILKEVKDE